MCQCLDSSPAPGYLGYPTDFTEQFVAGWRLGKGNCGLVYTAIRRADGKKLAVKCIPKEPEDPNTPEEERVHHLRLLKTEIEILKQLRGVPGQLQVEGVFEDATKVYLITELCKGGPLSKKRSKFNEREVIRYMRSVFEILANLHANGIVHRDVKEDNFLLVSKDKRSELRAIDFGIAARFTPDTLPVDDLGHPCGTLFYMAPEVCKAHWYPTSDVWAAGIMTAHMLTGVFPFNDPENPQDPDPRRTFRAIRKDPLNQSGSEWSKISPLAADFVRHLLVKEPIHRPTALQALQHPFLAVAEGDSVASSLSSSLLSSANISIDPMSSEEMPYPYSQPVEAESLAKRLQQYANISMAESSRGSSVSLSSMNPSLELTGSDDLGSVPVTPAAVEHVSFFKRLRNLTKGSRR